MVHALTLAVAQELAWSLATSLMAYVALVRAGGSYGVMPAAEFDGGPSAILCEHDPFAA
jgi:hypothetical protein